MQPSYFVKEFKRIVYLHFNLQDCIFAILKKNCSIFTKKFHACVFLKKTQKSKGRNLSKIFRDGGEIGLKSHKIEMKCP